MLKCWMAVVYGTLLFLGSELWEHIVGNISTGEALASFGLTHSLCPIKMCLLIQLGCYGFDCFCIFVTCPCPSCEALWIASFSGSAEGHSSEFHAGACWAPWKAKAAQASPILGNPCHWAGLLECFWCGDDRDTKHRASFETLECVTVVLRELDESGLYLFLSR